MSLVLVEGLTYTIVSHREILHELGVNWERAQKGKRSTPENREHAETGGKREEGEYLSYRSTGPPESFGKREAKSILSSLFDCLPHLYRVIFPPRSDVLPVWKVVLQRIASWEIGSPPILVNDELLWRFLRCVVYSRSDLRPLRNSSAMFDSPKAMVNPFLFDLTW